MTCLAMRVAFLLPQLTKAVAAPARGSRGDRGSRGARSVRGRAPLKRRALGPDRSLVPPSEALRGDMASLFTKFPVDDPRTEAWPRLSFKPCSDDGSITQGLVGPTEPGAKDFAIWSFEMAMEHGYTMPAHIKTIRKQVRGSRLQGLHVNSAVLCQLHS